MNPNIPSMDNPPPPPPPKKNQKCKNCGADKARGIKCEYCGRT